MYVLNFSLDYAFNINYNIPNSRFLKDYTTFVSESNLNWIITYLIYLFPSLLSQLCRCSYHCHCALSLSVHRAITFVVKCILQALLVAGSLPKTKLARTTYRRMGTSFHAIALKNRIFDFSRSGLRLREYGWESNENGDGNSWRWSEIG